MNAECMRGIRKVASDKHTTLAINKGAIHGETEK